MDLRIHEQVFIIALKKSLTLDFWNTSTLKQNSWKRLESLRLATLKEEKSYKRFVVHRNANTDFLVLGFFLIV